MRILVTGSAGHLGEALVRVLRGEGHEVVGLDVLASPWTDIVGSIADRQLVHEAMQGIHAVLHAATLHKPHVGSHTRQQFIDTSVTGTLTLLEEAVSEGADRFVFTSTTSSFGGALVPPPGAPATWIDEDGRNGQDGAHAGLDEQGRQSHAFDSRSERLLRSWPRYMRALPQCGWVLPSP